MEEKWENSIGDQLKLIINILFEIQIHNNFSFHIFFFFFLFESSNHHFLYLLENLRTQNKHIVYIYIATYIEVIRIYIYVCEPRNACPLLFCNQFLSYSFAFALHLLFAFANQKYEQHHLVSHEQFFSFIHSF